MLVFWSIRMYIFEDMRKLKIRILGAQLFGQYCQSQVKMRGFLLWLIFFEEKESKCILIRYLCFDKNNPNFVSFCCYSSYYYYLTPHFNFFCRTLSENCYYIQRITYYFNFFWLNLRICKKYKRFNSDRVI